MATLQIRLDDNLKEQAETVLQGMGFDLPAVVRVFLTQVVKENGFPFQPSNDPFYSRTNMVALRESIAQVNAGQHVTTTLERLRCMEG